MDSRSESGLGIATNFRSHSRSDRAAAAENPLMGGSATLPSGTSRSPVIRRAWAEFMCSSKSKCEVTVLQRITAQVCDGSPRLRARMRPLVGSYVHATNLGRPDATHDRARMAGDAHDT